MTRVKIGPPRETHPPKRRAIFGVALVALALSAPVHVSAQSNAEVVANCGTPNETYNVGQHMPQTQNQSGLNCSSATVTGLTAKGVTTTESAGTVTTHATFQSALAANAARNGCTLMNTSTDIEYVFFGATGSATTSNSFALGAAPVAGGEGGSINCAVGGLSVATDNVAITSKTNDGATFVVSTQ